MSSHINTRDLAPRHSCLTPAEQLIKNGLATLDGILTDVEPKDGRVTIGEPMWQWICSMVRSDLQMLSNLENLPVGSNQRTLRELASRVAERATDFPKITTYPDEEEIDDFESASLELAKDIDAAVHTISKSLPVYTGKHETCLEDALNFSDEYATSRRWCRDWVESRAERRAEQRRALHVVE